jgi:Fe-S oxidoreductase
MRTLVPGVVLAAAMSVALLGCFRMIWRLRAARTAPIAWRGLLCLPQRYLRDVHRVVARDKRAARMHVLSAGGFTSGTVLAIVVFGAGASSEVLVLGVALSGILMLCGAAIEWVRRFPVREARLPAGSYDLMPAALTAYALFLILASLEQLGLVTPTPARNFFQALTFACGIAGGSFLIAGFAIGPMRHALAGVLHISFHPRQMRFKLGSSDTALPLLDLDSERLGVQHVRDFDWRQWLGFESCVQCGRCEAVCPAFAAGTPLNPRQLIFSLWRATREVAVIDHDSASTATPELVGTVIHPDVIWACTTCRACVEECPMMIEHVDAIIDLRRGEILEKGTAPGKVPETLDLLETTATACGQGSARRLELANDLNLDLAAARGSFEFLLWLGEGALESRGQRTVRAVVKLLKHAGIDVAVLGDEEPDCGDLARRVGDEYRFRQLAERAIAALARYRFTAIITCDPHVLHCLRNEYPALGARYRVLHHTEVLEQLQTQGSLRFRPDSNRSVTYHDPCYLGRYSGEFDAPRRLLSSLFEDVREMERSRSQSFCCGGGGGAPIADVAQQRRVPDLRMDQARATGAGCLAVACPNCALMLESAAGPLVVMDIAELASELLLDATPVEHPSATSSQGTSA